MEPTERVRFKVCCISSAAELEATIEAGASAVGLVSSMPSGPGVIPDERIAELAGRVPPGVDSFLLTSLQDADAIIEQHRHARTSTLQLVDELPAGAHARLRAALPGIRLVQVVHVVDDRAIDEAAKVAESVDAVLLDSGNPALDAKELGGTGRRHDWAVSARIRRQLDVPVFLAGGLNPDNVAGAIDTVGPFALDVCTGVRDDAFALDHVALQVDDVDAAVAFYLRAFAPLGFREVMRFVRDNRLVVGLAGLGRFPHFWLSAGDGAPGREVHIAFGAPDRAAVDAVHHAAVEAGAEILHPPREWPEYHPTYHGVFLRDLDGNNVEAVHHGFAG